MGTARPAETNLALAPVFAFFPACLQQRIGHYFNKSYCTIYQGVNKGSPSRGLCIKNCQKDSSSVVRGCAMHKVNFHISASGDPLDVHLGLNSPCRLWDHTIGLGMLIWTSWASLAKHCQPGAVHMISGVRRQAASAAPSAKNGHLSSFSVLLHTLFDVFFSFRLSFSLSSFPSAADDLSSLCTSSP